jgi:hypothetical protein
MLVLGAMALLLLVATACGDDDNLGVDAQAAREAEASADASATTADVEACALLTEAEASELLGVTVTSVEPMVIRAFDACEWVNDESLPVQALQVGLFDFKASSQVLRDTAGALGELEEVDGLGDEAVWNSSQLYILKGDRMMSIFPSRDGGRDQAVAAAELVVPRLD